MQYVKFGRTGLDVSPLCIGCMTFGIPDRGPHTWTLDEDKTRPIIARAVAAGIIQIEEDARPGASAAIEPGDPARHANRGGSGGLTLLKDGAPRGPSRPARKRRRRRRRGLGEDG